MKPNPPSPVRGDLLSASQIADRFPSNYPPLENLDSGDEERAAEEEDEKEVFSFHLRLPYRRKHVTKDLK